VRLHNTLGWVDVGTIAQEYGGDLLDFMNKYGKWQKKCFCSTDLLRKAMELKCT
jgi:hypothetical protein